MISALLCLVNFANCISVLMRALLLCQDIHILHSVLEPVVCQIPLDEEARGMLKPADRLEHHTPKEVSAKDYRRALDEYQHLCNQSRSEM